MLKVPPEQQPNVEDTAAKRSEKIIKSFVLLMEMIWFLVIEDKKTNSV